MNSMRSLTAAALLAGLAGSATGQLTVDTDLGTLSVGSYNLTGSTLGQPNNLSGYRGSDLAFFGFVADLGEFVYSFQVDADTAASIENNEGIFVGSDNDHYLTDGLAFTPGFDLFGDGTLFGDVSDATIGFVDEAGDFAGVMLSPGTTYYLSVDTYGQDFEGDYDINLVLTAFVPGTAPTVFTDLGVIGDSASATTFSLCAGTFFDSEMAIYDVDGNLIDSDDDGCGTVGGASELTAALGAGSYWAAVTGWDTTFGNGWVAGGSGRDFGDAVGTFGSASIGPDFLNPDEVLWYLFEIDGSSPPCPGDIADDNGTPGADGQVSFGDFLASLGLLGPCGPATGNPDCTGDNADDNGTPGGDGQVSFGDFLFLLGVLGPCP